MKAESVNLLEAVCQEAESLGSLFRDNIPGRDALWAFLDANGWFGMERDGSGRDTRVASLEPMRTALDLWLRAYGRSREEKIALMLEAYAPKFPRTCRMFREFISATDSERQDSAWKLLDFLLSSLEREIDEYDANAVCDLVTQANRELSLTAMRLLTDFLRFSVNEIWIYQFHSRQLVKTENGAYTLEQFSVMAYVIFNEESWKARNLIRKASEKRKYAELWLFAALHFVCAVRKTDIVRLPLPDLPYPSSELRGRILRGLFTRQEARSVSEEILFRLDMKPLKPNKTKRYRAPSLKLFIPESLLEPLGVILALSLSWREPDDPFVSVKAELSDMYDFFGEEFVKAAGGKRFRSRRANKAYLQGIELTADEGNGVKGYMLAALARSHKGGIAKLAQTTDIYLRDANFSGCSPEFILREMFERGVFGFIPALLLENYAGKAFRRLGVSAQTELIKLIGLDALQIESVTDAVMKSFRQSSEIVKSLLREQCGDKSSLAAVLQKIASGAAPSRQSELLCLRVAAGCPCCEPDRSGCLGCRYEIYTKSAMRLFMKEYVRLNREKEDADAFQRERLANILEKGVLPAVGEMLASVPMLYPGADLEPLYDIMERGIRDADDTAN
jgi:hypothetical protein